LAKNASELFGYLDANRDSLPNYGARYRVGLPISTAFTESAVNEVVAKRMNKNQPMRWNRYTVQPRSGFMSSMAPWKTPSGPFTGPSGR
jgi:hypothetical protein